MAMTKPVQIGGVINYTNSGTDAIAARDVVALKNTVGIAQTDIPVGSTGALILHGVHSVPAETSAAFEVGQLVYWSTTNKCASATATGNIPMGIAVEPKATATASAVVKLGVALALVTA